MNETEPLKMNITTLHVKFFFFPQCYSLKGSLRDVLSDINWLTILNLYKWIYSVFMHSFHFNDMYSTPCSFIILRISRREFY